MDFFSDSRGPVGRRFRLLFLVDLPSDEVSRHLGERAKCVQRIVPCKHGGAHDHVLQVGRWFEIELLDHCTFLCQVANVGCAILRSSYEKSVVARYIN